MIPKSTAPSESRLAREPAQLQVEEAPSSETRDDERHDDRGPGAHQESRRRGFTRSAPTTRLCVTVVSVRRTSWLRS